jgi:hypothetical protein
MRRRVLCVAGVVALLLAGVALALTSFAQRSIARAKVDAAKQLASVVLPHPARKVRHDPSIGRVLGRQGVACTKKYVAEPHGFWRIPGKPDRVWKWLREHPARSSRLLASGMLKHGNTPLAWYVEFSFPDQRNVTARVDYLALRHARGGGTALRIDAVAVGEPRPHHAPCFSAGSY